MNTTKAILCLIFLIFVASVTLPSGKWYLYPLGGGCMFLIFVTLVFLCCTALHSDEFKDFSRNLPKYFRDRWRGSVLGSAISSWLEKGRKRCCLCCALVENEAWEEHRTTCAIEHAEELEQMPHSHREWGPKKCPKCEEFMRVWPGQGEKFQCDNNRMCRHSEGGAVVNRGEPPWMKFSCFPCDLNFCSTCVLPETITAEDEEPFLDIATDDLDPIPWVRSVGQQGSRLDNLPYGSYPIGEQEPRLDDLPYVDLPRFDIPRTQNPGSIPWIPSAPPDDTKSDTETMNPPSYQEAIAP